MTGDGRLTPDDLDLALGDQTRVPSAGEAGAAASPDEPVEDLGLASDGTDELAAGPDEPTWGARIVGVVRGHKRLTAVTAACLLVLGALTAGYVRTRPPPLDTRIDANVWFQPNALELSGVSIQNGVARSLLYLQVPAGGAALTATSLSGPGLGPGSVTQHGSDVTVSNPLDCNTIGDFARTAPAPVLHVTRTDAWGRPVSAALPVSDDGGTAGVTVSQVSQAVRQMCVAQLGTSLQLVGVRTATGSATTVVVLTIHNPTRWHVGIPGADAGFGPPDATLGYAFDPSNAPLPATMTVAAGATATVALPVTRLNCGVEPRRARDQRTGNLTLMISPVDEAYGLSAQTTMTLTPAQRTAVVAALAVPCVGAPKLSYVITAGPPAFGGIDFSLDVTTPKGTITLRPDANYASVPPFFDGAFRLGPGSSGRVTLSGQLSASCSSPISQSSPQRLRAAVAVGARYYPYRIWFNTMAVLEAESRLCRQVPDLAQARSKGWAV